MSISGLFGRLMGRKHSSAIARNPSRANSAFELTLEFSGSGKGSVSRIPPDMESANEVAAIYSANSIVTLIASPADDSVFTGWSGDFTGSESTYSLTMDVPKKIVANFSLAGTRTEALGKFVDNGNGTVTDKTTGLMWMRFSEGQEWRDQACMGEAKRFALDAAKAIRRDFAGYTDWRLPTLDELKSIVDQSRSDPAYDPSIFSGYDKSSTPLYWTSTKPWYVSFYSGEAFSCDLNASCLYEVRLVRNATLSENGGFDTARELPPLVGRDNSEAADEFVPSVPSVIKSNLQYALTESGFDYLLRDIEATDKPSVSLMKALANQSLLVSRVGGAKNRTLLHHAAAHGKLATVKYLCLKCRANPNATDQDGDTPLDYALASNAVVVAEYLRSKEARTRTDLSAPVPNHLQLNKTVSEMPMEETETAQPTDLVQSSTPVPVFGGDVFRAESIDAVKNVTAELTQRIEQLEASLREVLLKLETLEAHQVSLPKADGTEGNRDTVAPTFPKALAWLATQDRVSLAVLRDRLLPLDRLTGAVIDELNERALDLMGEIALEESGEEILVFREVLATVIANQK